MIPVANTRYELRLDDSGYTIVRPAIGGGYFTVAGPYLTRYEAEVEALRRARARKAA
jgi:hypothetical protein